MEPLGTSYVSMEAFVAPIEVPPGGTLDREVSVYATNITNADRTLTLQIATSSTLEAASYTMPTTVTIPAGSNEGKINLALVDVGLDIANEKTITFNVIGTSEINVGDSFSLNVSRACPSGTQKLRIAVTLDLYPEEVFWRVINADAGTVVLMNNTTAGFGGYAGLARNSVQRAASCLAPGNYYFQIFDQFDDGGGAVLITLPSGIVWSSDGKYASPTRVDFTVN